MDLGRIWALVPEPSARIAGNQAQSGVIGESGLGTPRMNGGFVEPSLELAIAGTVLLWEQEVGVAASLYVQSTIRRAAPSQRRPAAREIGAGKPAPTDGI